MTNDEFDYSAYNGYGNNIQYQPIKSQSTTSQTGQTNGDANSATPTSDTSKNNNHNFDITNPFNRSTNRNTEEGSKQVSQTTQSTSQKQVTFDEIVNSKNFGQLTKDLFDKVNDGDVTEFNNSLQGALRSVYKTAIEDSNKLLEARMTSLEEKIFSKINDSKAADGIISDLKKAVPYANDPAVEPVARQVLSGYLRQGMSKSEAIGATNSYFDRLAQSVGQSKQAKDTMGSSYKSGKDAWDDLFND